MELRAPRAAGGREGNEERVMCGFFLTPSDRASRASCVPLTESPNTAGQRSGSSPSCHEGAPRPMSCVARSRAVAFAAAFHAPFAERKSTALRAKSRERPVVCEKRRRLDQRVVLTRVTGSAGRPLRVLRTGGMDGSGGLSCHMW